MNFKFEKYLFLDRNIINRQNCSDLFDVKYQYRIYSNKNCSEAKTTNHQELKVNTNQNNLNLNLFKKVIILLARTLKTTFWNNRFYQTKLF